MKIGVVTYFRDIYNAGTNLQAYCTYKTIQKMFPQAKVEIIDFKGWKDIEKPYLSGCSFQTIKNDYIRIKKIKTFVREQFSFSERSLVSSDYDDSTNFIRSFGYDAIFVGADTLLELDRATKDSLTGYWLHESIKSKKILLAASAKNVTYAGMSEKQRCIAKSTIDDYSLLGVRDDSTYRLLKHFTPESDPRLKIIPDPTFMLNTNVSYIEEYLRKKGLNFDKPTICLHLRRQDIWGYDLSYEFKKRGFQIASLRPGRYADIVLNDLSPLEHFGIFKYFKMVITHRFHDTIFSILNHTPVITYPADKSYTTENEESKYSNLLKGFGILETNYIKDPDTITAPFILSLYEQALLNFADHVPDIEGKVRQYQQKYLDYLGAAQKIIIT